MILEALKRRNHQKNATISNQTYPTNMQSEGMAPISTTTNQQNTRNQPKYTKIATKTYQDS